MSIIPPLSFTHFPLLPSLTLLYQVNTAAYSPRPHTPAAAWPSQLPEDVKQDRLQRINRLASLHALERTSRFVGRVQDVLVEEINVKNPSQLVGRNPHSRLVYFEG